MNRVLQVRAMEHIVTPSVGRGPEARVARPLIETPHPPFGHLLPASGAKGNRLPLAPHGGERVARSAG